MEQRGGEELEMLLVEFPTQRTRIRVISPQLVPGALGFDLRLELLRHGQPAGGRHGVENLQHLVEGLLDGGGCHAFPPSIERIEAAA